MPFSKRKSIFSYLLENNQETESETISNKTDQWIRTVEAAADGVISPSDVTDLFCKDGILWGTVSQVLRIGYSEINEYFQYFATIPGLKVVDSDYTISKISDDVYVNNARINWINDTLNGPLEARMTFIYKRTGINKDWCLFELHSSEIPDVNENVN